MNKRLKYEKYMGTNNIIKIDLHNGYTIISIITKINNTDYDVHLMLKENTVDRWDTIEEAEHLAFSIDNNEKNIYSVILKHVNELLHKGFFEYYINRYEYEMLCFDRGNNLYEEERLNNV